MTAHMSVTASESGDTSVIAEFNVGNSITDYVAISAGETVLAKVAGLSQTMSQASLLGITSYGTTFTGEGAAGTTYAVAYNRTADDVSAPGSSAALPQPFSITSPANGLSFSRANDDIAVAYADSGLPDPMSWTSDTACVSHAGQGLTGDPGSFTIPKGTLVANTAGATCSVTLTLTRTHAGSVDPAYQGGDFNAIQARVLTFTSKP